MLGHLDKLAKSPLPNISPNISVSSSSLLTLSETAQSPESANSSNSVSTAVTQEVWKKRFFVLTSDGKLFAFRPNPSDFTTPVSYMITSATKTHDQEHNVFKVFGNTVRASDGALQKHTWTLRGSSGEDVVEVWIDCIDRVVSCAQEDVLERLEHAFTTRSGSSRRSSHATLVGGGSSKRGGGGMGAVGGTVNVNGGLDGADENNAKNNESSIGDGGLERTSSISRGRERARKLFPSKSILTLETRDGNYQQEKTDSNSLVNGGSIRRNSSVTRTSLLSATSVTTTTSVRPSAPVTIEGLVRKNTNASLTSTESITQKTGRWFKWLVKASDGGGAGAGAGKR
ncbi:hypothetical protein HK100_008007, partial [Physocladia obscura]